MKTLKKSIAAVSLLLLTSASANAAEFFNIQFNFAGGTTPSIISNPDDAITVSNITGATSGAAPTVFSFDFDVASSYFATLDQIFYTTTSTPNTLSRVLLNGAQVGLATFSPFNVIFPGLSGLTGGTITVESIAISGQEQFSLNNLFLTGTLSVIPETGTLLLSGLGLAAFIAVYRKRRSASVEADASVA